MGKIINFNAVAETTLLTLGLSFIFHSYDVFLTFVDGIVKYG